MKLGNRDLELVNAGCDWITATSSDKAVAASLTKVFDWACSYSESIGQSPKAMSKLGYDGYACTGAFYGIRPEGGWMLQLSGSVARMKAQQVIQFGPNITRIDFQITVRTEDYTPQIAREVYEEYLLARSTKMKNLPRKRMLITTDGNGDTCQIGSRTSERFLRVYDKDKQSPELDEYVNCWRFEIEYKGDAANWYAAQYAREPLLDGSASIVGRQMNDWGIALNGYPYAAIPRFKPERMVTDNERTMAWLDIQVRPTIIRLLGEGYEPKNIMMILGFDNS